MLPLAILPPALEILAGVVGAIVVHNVLPKKINIDIEFD